MAVVLAGAVLIGRPLRAASKRVRAALKLAGGAVLGIGLLGKFEHPSFYWPAGSEAATDETLLFRIAVTLGLGLLFVSWAADLGGPDPG